MRTPTFFESSSEVAEVTVFVKAMVSLFKVQLYFVDLILLMVVKGALDAERKEDLVVLA